MIHLSPGLASFVSLGVLAFDGARVRENEPRLDEPLAKAEQRMREAGPDDVEVASVRAMYRRVGLDPTKTRPSSEALLRRVRKGDRLPRINTLVDACNWCSLEWQLPYGLYDRDRIEGEVVLRLGAAGECYDGIRKDAVHVGGRITLSDDMGPFGNPTSDSARTMVTTATSRALVVIFAPRGSERLQPALDLTAARVVEFTGARERERAVL